MESNVPVGERKVTWKSYQKRHMRQALERCGLLQPGRQLSFARLAAKVEYHVGPCDMLNGRMFIAANEMKLASDAKRAKREVESDVDDSDEERDWKKKQEEERPIILRVEENRAKYDSFQKWMRSIAVSQDVTRDYRLGLKAPESKCRRDTREDWLRFCRDPESYRRCCCRSCLDLF